ncbi:MAG: hypothetical protein PHR77_06360 [Kiritimatiellae bacterium]|nr:hypothetical protein [Kiritimatiellia bacterium]MDD5522657.1 hypothetical protein [Kiritimatiellia bacterium]
MKIRILIAAFLFLCATALYYRHLYRKHVDTPDCSPEQIKAIQDLSQRLKGVVVFQREDEKKIKIDGIYKTFIGDPRTIMLVKNGRYPRWSPDGRYVAFIRDKKIMHMTSGGRKLEVLAETSTAKPSLTYNPNGKEVLYPDGMDIKAVDIQTRQIRKVASGYPFVALDISMDNRHLVATIAGHQMYGFDLESGDHWLIGIGCSSSLSPDGTLLSSNTGTHRRMKILKWKSSEETGHFDPPKYYERIDNEFWSNKHDWLVACTEYPSPKDIFVYELFTKNPKVQVTFSGDCNRPDLYVSDSSPGIISKLINWLKTWLFL